MRGLTEGERSLIDAAIRAGRVQKISRGTSAFPTPKWNGFKLVLPEETMIDSVMPTRMRRLPPEIRERREKVAALHADGLSVAAICAALDASEWTVRNDHHTLGLAFNAPKEPPPPPRPVAIDPATVERRNRIVPMRCGGMTKRAIAEALGVRPAVIENDLRVLIRDKRVPEGIDPMNKSRRRRNAA